MKRNQESVTKPNFVVMFPLIMRKNVHWYQRLDVLCVLIMPLQSWNSSNIWSRCTTSATTECMVWMSSLSQIKEDKKRPVYKWKKSILAYFVIHHSTPASTWNNIWQVSTLQVLITKYNLKHNDQCHVVWRRIYWVMIVIVCFDLDLVVTVAWTLH